nr:MAG TPA: hypothetical protein [Caudoviricetes sp.]
MREFKLSIGAHRWGKINLVTQGKKHQFDIFQCVRCGLVGKSYCLGTITIPEKDVPKMNKCKGVKQASHIKITYCRAFGNEFSGLTPGSIHTIIHSPKGENNQRGEWVMGKTEPVLVLFGEFEYIEAEL